MKHIHNIIAAAILLFAMSSCGLMDTESTEKLSGDEMWDKASYNDVDGFASSMYYLFRAATMQDSYFILYSGDLRCAPTTGPSGKYYREYLADNDLNGLRAKYSSDKDKHADGIMRWQSFYKVIQSANILYKEVDRASISNEEKQAFRDEAIFMRCLSYFFLVRNFGDVPYYTNAYNQKALPRTDMVTVLQNISQELQSILDGDPNATILPWRQTLLSKKNVRASRGAVLALLMHVNMWLAGFDEQNATSYYNKVVDFGKQLVDNNDGGYQLLSMGEMSDVMAGGSNEGIFEITQNLSYESGNEVFQSGAVFANETMYSPFGSSRANVEYTYDFLVKIFPPGVEDERVTNWFDENMYSTLEGTKKEILKFKNVDTYGSNSTTANAGNQIIFRFADAILLYAEALADLGSDDAKACELLNMIRTRAGASNVTATGSELQDAIYWERVRELIGEGQYYYDLVRTKKVCDASYCYHNISIADFNQGAWTWPISKSAQNQNTQLQLNNYWE